MESKICFEMISFVVEAIRERCASFGSLTATVSEICGGQTNVPILVVGYRLPGYQTATLVIMFTKWPLMKDLKRNFADTPRTQALD